MYAELVVYHSSAQLLSAADSMPQSPKPEAALKLPPQSMMPRMNPNASPGYSHTGPTHNMGKLIGPMGDMLDQRHYLTGYPRPSHVGPPGPGGLVRSLVIPSHGPGMEYVDYSPVGNVGRLVGDARPAVAHPIYTPSIRYTQWTPAFDTMYTNHFIPPPSLSSSPSLSQPPQPWHQIVTPEVRSYLIKKL